MTSDLRNPANAAWEAFDQHAGRVAPMHLRDLLGEPGRSERMFVEAAGIQADFSKQRIDDAALSALFELATSSDFDRARHRMFKGERINTTEDRPVLHAALRGVGGSDAVTQQVQAERDKVARLADQLRAGQLKGHGGQPLRHLICIGIGGSDLGPRLICDALRHPGQFDVRFVANVDPSDLHLAIADLDPARTAFAIVSKTFTTRETLANAEAALRWIEASGASTEAARRHLIGVTAAPDAAVAWGVPETQVVRFWDWVGGRYSLWSAVGLSIAVACGNDVHAELLDGAAEMDRHFRDKPVTANLPVWMGLLSVWNRNALQLPTLAVIPYAERLRLLPSFLQQLVMESNGKSARLDGTKTARLTAPVVWGVSGTNAQHSFFQQLHQGPDVVPVDFIIARSPEPALTGSHALDARDDRHAILQANCLAQSSALALGKPLPGEKDGSTDWHRAFPGNRPSTTLMIPRVDARSVGALVAAYEHATFTASVVLGINAFDQFGVEYGKVLAKSIEQAMSGQPQPDVDPTTQALIRRLADRG